jgi:hypothetical protein
MYCSNNNYNWNLGGMKMIFFILAAKDGVIR